jgi:hypothetical protein
MGHQNNSYMYNPDNYDPVTGNLKDPVLQQFAQTAMQATAQQRADSQSGVGALEKYRPQDGYLFGDSEKYRKDNRRLTTKDNLRRINPLGGRGHLNQQQYKDKYNADGSHRYNMMDNLNPAATPVLTQSVAEPTTHTMPDGTVMPGATHEYTSGPGILARPQPERYVPAPVEENRGMDPMTPEESAAFRLTPAGQRIYGSVPGGEMGDQTGGRRDSTALAAAKKTQHVSFGEAMGRYGGAIMNAGSQGGMAQVGAMGTVTGEIADIERAENAYLAEQQAAEQKIRDAQQKEAAKESAEFDEILGEYDSAIGQMDILYADVLSYGDDLTGPKDGYFDAWMESLRGDPKAYTRLAMDQFKVDEILKNVAKTKGAISDREMATFERPMPSMMADESVWLDWIDAKRQAAISVRKKLRAMQSGDSGGSSSNYSPEEQALIDQYSN